jgi:hypothetical protein
MKEMKEEDRNRRLKESRRAGVFKRAIRDPRPAF